MARTSTTIGSSGTSATAKVRDARREAYLAEMGGGTITTTKNNPTTTSTSTKTTGSSGYVPTYGPNALYTGAGNTATSNTQTSTGGTKQTNSGTGTTAPTPTKSTDSSGSGRRTGTGSLPKGLSAVSPPTTAQRLTDRDAYDTGVRNRHSAQQAAENHPYHDKMSQEDQEIRKKYYEQMSYQEQQQYHDQVRKTVEQLEKAAQNSQVHNMQENIAELQTQAAPIAQRATHENSTGSRQHNNFLQTQIADQKILLEQYKKDNLIFTEEELARLKRENEKKAAAAQAQIDALDDMSTMLDLDSMTMEEYLAGANANLQNRLDWDAEVTGSAKNNVALDRIGEYQSKYYDDTFGGRIQANYTDGRLEQDINLAYNDYLDDPTDQNWEYAQKLEALQTQFQANNSFPLNEEGFAPISRDLAQALPGLVDETVSKLPGKAVGLLLSAATGGFIPPDIASTVGEAISGSAHTYDVARGAAFRALLQAGVSEETAAEAAKDEAVINALIDATGSLLGEPVETGTKKWIDNSTTRTLVNKLGEYGISKFSDKLSSSVSQANIKRTLDGKGDDGTWNLFLTGFMSEN